MSKVIHFEIPANDTEKVVSFYRNVFDWKIESWGDDKEYWLCATGEESEQGIHGAIYAVKGENKTTVNTISVDNLENFVEKILQNGGEITQPRMVIPGVGYIAMCKDDEGTPFGILQADPAVTV